MMTTMKNKDYHEKGLLKIKAGTKVNTQTTFNAFKLAETPIEADNNKNDNSSTPFSSPVLSNITLIGDGFTDTYGMKLREGTKAEIYNIITRYLPLLNELDVEMEKIL
jgi:hypothetical protein